MKKLFIVANWKANKTLQQAEKWLAEFTIDNLQFTKDKEIVICPSFTLLENLKSYFLHHKSLLKVGSQDISPFAEGAYTGEVTAEQIKEFAIYVIIGHSERRKEFHEDEDIILKKLLMAQKLQLTPILCISQLDQLSGYTTYMNQSPFIVAYEPLSAIGSGEADDPKNADEMAKKIKEMAPTVIVLYGGSVTAENVNSFTQMPHIDGVLVGGASLDPQEFSKIITNA